MADDDLPVGLDRDQHVDISRRQRYVWLRRAAMIVVAAIPLLALFNVFGQRSGQHSTTAARATLSIDSPARVRGGLVFTTHFTITPKEDLHDARLLLDNGWFKAMTFNGAAPQPTNESAQGKWQVYDYGQMSAGVPFSIWLSWQVNPTNFGRHAHDVALYDGSSQILTVHPSIMVFP